VPSAATYNLYRGTSGEPVALYTSGITGGSYADSGVSQNETYTYAVSALNDAGESALSDTVTAEPDPAPDAPTGFAAAALTHDHVELFWEDMSYTESGFFIERHERVPGGTWDEWSELQTVPADTTRFADRWCEGGMEYEYRIAATSDAGSSSYAVGTATTPAAPSPAESPINAPQGLSAAPVAGVDYVIRLTWLPPSNVSGFVYVEAAREGKNFKTVASLPASQAVYDFTGEGTTKYAFRLRVDDGVGAWAYSDSAAATAAERPRTPWLRHPAPLHRRTRGGCARRGPAA